MQGAGTKGLNGLFALLAIYAIALFAALGAVFLIPVPAPWRSLVVLIPLLPAAALVRWETRALVQLDEMHLRNQIVAIAWAFAITAMLMVAYILLEAVGWPRLPMWIVFLAMMLIRSACSLFQWYRYR
jgi:hypothetical protein